MIDRLKSLMGLLTSKKSLTADYEGTAGNYGPWAYNPKRPLFTYIMAQAMLADPHVKFGLYLIKGPILSGSRFLIKSEDERLRQFVIQQMTQFWTTGAKLALRCMHYGWYGAEVMYCIKDGMLHFDKLLNLDPQDVIPYQDNGELTGMMVRGSRNSKQVFIPYPKLLWTVHGREYSRWWGQSRLYGSHIPWYEYNAPEGFRDSRRLWFYKNSFDSGVIRFPAGVSITPDGRKVDNRDVAQSVLDQQRNGGGICLPKNNNPAMDWEWERPQAQDLSVSFNEYGSSLRDEVWEGLGVPPEIAKAQGTGAYAGRQIPQEAFYALLQEIVQDVLTDFDTQILRPLTAINFGPNHAGYDIECFGLLRSLEEDRGNHKDDARQPLGVTEGGDQTADPHLNQPAQLNMAEVCLARRPHAATQAFAFKHAA